MIVTTLKNAKFLSTIDLKNAFWQIPLTESSKEKTAFSVPFRGLFHFNVLPFGLCNAAQIQQRLMDNIFGPELQPYVLKYLDDIVVIGTSFSHHLAVLKEVYKRLLDANLTINFEKCKFFRKSLPYLGFVMDCGSGLKTCPEKIKAIVEYKKPESMTQLKGFLGICSWYRRFVPHFSTIVSPLNDLLKGKGKRQPLTWTVEVDELFGKLKNI